MRKKLLIAEITDCLQCMYYQENYLLGDVCNYGPEPRSLKPINEMFPDWCPLPDVNPDPEDTCP